jgi:hypothetical protein
MKHRVVVVVGALCAMGPLLGAAQSDAGGAHSPHIWAAYPIFHQILVFSQQRGFVSADEMTQSTSYLQESVLQGETVDRWTQMISVNGLQGAVANPDITPDSGPAFYASRYKTACPATFSVAHLPADSIAKFSGRILFLGCGAVGEAGHEHSESMLLVSLKGDQDYYNIQWAERGPPSSKPLAFDQGKWTQRLQLLAPFRICARVPGEAPPYPSCIHPKGS